MDFLKLFRMYIEFHSTTSIQSEKRKSKTIDAYSVRYRSIADYLLSKDLIKLNSVDFNIKLAKDYFAHLSEKHSHNYAVRHVELCRTVLNYGASEMLIKYNPLNSLKLKKTMPGKPIFLNKKELELFESVEVKGTMLNRAKDMFLFQCYTGFDYTDLMSVTVDHIITQKGRKWLIKSRNKTENEAFIPYSDKAKVIFEKNDHSMCFMSNQKYNAALKLLSVHAGIDKRITSHMGRKTYAMYMLNNEGFSMEAVSKMLGHKSVKTTENYYARVGMELVSRELDRLMA